MDFRKVMHWMLAAALLGAYGCKPRQEQSAIKAEGEASAAQRPVSPEARQAVQAVQAACGRDSALLRGADDDHVDFVPVGSPAAAGIDHDPFYERATFAEGRWHLSTGIRDGQTPACVAGRLYLSTEELIGALGCAGIDPCQGQAKQASKNCTLRNGQVVPESGDGSGLVFADFAACEALASSESARDAFAQLAKAEPPQSENRVLGGDGGNQTAMALTGEAFAWAKYGDPNRAFHLVKTNYSGELMFKPDTLYSWGPYAKLDWLENQSWSGRLTRDYRDSPLYATTSPFGSMGYGNFSIRIKLKTYGVKYKFVSEYPFRPGRSREYCRDYDVDPDSTVVVRYWDNGSITGLDYIICGMGPVHSWSWGTKEHYNEMNAEVRWMGSHNYRDYELYVKQRGADLMHPRVDGNNPSAEQWQTSVSYHYMYGFGSAAHRNDRGLIHFNPDADGQTPDEHFRTNSPVYFNPE